MPVITVSLPTQEELHFWFTYNPETGDLRWKNRPGRNAHIGELAGCRTSEQVRLKRRFYYISRIIHKWMTGEDPPEQIDHHNGNRHDMRWINLRPATHQQNAWNRVARNQQNLPKGISRVVRVSGAVEYIITVNGRNCGTYPDLGWAIDVQEEMSYELQGEFAVHRRPAT